MELASGDVISPSGPSLESTNLARGSDSVELKLTVPETDQRPTVAALEVDPLEAQIRQVFFFDTPDLTLSRHGVVVRLRRVQKKGDDSVVKLRPVVPIDPGGEQETKTRKALQRSSTSRASTRARAQDSPPAN